MKPVDQDVFGAPDGNCFSACLASLLELPLDALREVERIYRDGSRVWHKDRESVDGAATWAAAWRDVQSELMRTTGYACAYIVGAAPAGYAIASGKSPRGDFGHSVIALDGVIAHDPHPSRAGLDRIEDFAVLVRVVR